MGAGVGAGSFVTIVSDLSLSTGIGFPVSGHILKRVNNRIAATTTAGANQYFLKLLDFELFDLFI